EYEDLADRAAELPRYRVGVLVEKVRPVLAREEIARGAVGVADAEPVRVGDGLVAVRAEEVALDERGHVSVVGRRARRKVEPRLPGVQGELASLVVRRSSGGSDRDRGVDRLLVCHGVDALGNVAVYGVELDIPAKLDRGGRAGKPERARNVAAGDHAGRRGFSL